MSPSDSEMVRIARLGGTTSIEDLYQHYPGSAELFAKLVALTPAIKQLALDRRWRYTTRSLNELFKRGSGSFTIGPVITHEGS